MQKTLKEKYSINFSSFWHVQIVNRIWSYILMNFASYILLSNKINKIANIIFNIIIIIVISIIVINVALSVTVYYYYYWW